MKVEWGDPRPYLAEVAPAWPWHNCTPAQASCVAFVTCGRSFGSIARSKGTTRQNVALHYRAGIRNLARDMTGPPEGAAKSDSAPIVNRRYIETSEWHLVVRRALELSDFAVETGLWRQADGTWPDGKEVTLAELHGEDNDDDEGGALDRRPAMEDRLTFSRRHALGHDTRPYDPNDDLRWRPVARERDDT